MRRSRTLQVDLPAAAVPRFGQIAARLTRNGYFPVPLVFGQKRPIPSEWQRYQFTPVDKQRYEHAGTGLLCGQMIVVDIDVYDARLAKEITSIAKRMLGPAPLRVGLAPKRALIYRASGDPFPKIQTAGFRLDGDSPDSKAHRVEILANGQQLAAFNLHPLTGEPYKWLSGRSPLTVPFSDLAPVTYTQVQEFVRKAEAVLARAGSRVGALTQAEIDAHMSGAELRALDSDAVRHALESIPNDDLPYDDWIRVGLAIKGALGESGLSDWRRWSARSTKDSPAETERAWRSFKPARIGAGTIYFHAERNGWRKPPAGLRREFGTWPASLNEAALYGLFGDIVRAIEPDTESDPAGLLLQSIVAFGSLVGRGPYYQVEGDRHYANLFLVLVGQTAKARKGTSWGWGAIQNEPASAWQR